MVSISLKKFRIIDLLVLIIIGIIGELFSMGVLFNGNGLRPTFIVSALIILTCITRWGIKGIIGAPILAVVTWLGGKYFIHSKTNPYDWVMLISMIVGNCSMILICPIYKKYGTNKIMGDSSRVALVALCSCILNILAAALVYLLCSVGSSFGFNLFLYDLPGLIVTLIIGVALSKMGMEVNVKDQMLANKKQAEEDAKYEKEYMKMIDEKSQERKVL